MIGEELESVSDLIEVANYGTIVVAADGTAWQYANGFWWPADYRAKRSTAELADVEGFLPVTVVHVP